MGEREIRDDAIEVDLFGNEVYRRPGKRGRPPFERTEENARKVSMLLAMGWSNDRIAACIRDPRTGRSISVPTLKRHFRAELQLREVARDQLTARRLMATAELAFAGNVGAQRYLGQLIEQNDLMLAEMRARRKAAEVKPAEKPGKKEIAERQAEAAEEAMRARIAQEARSARRH